MGQALDDKRKKEIKNEATAAAVKAMYVAFHILNLKTETSSVVKMEDGNEYYIRFEKIDPNKKSMPEFQMLMQFILPSHEECEHAMQSGNATPLHQLIHEHEPAGNEDSNQFRTDLLALISFLNHTGNLKTQAAMAQLISRLPEDVTIVKDSDEEPSKWKILDGFHDMIDDTDHVQEDDESEVDFFLRVGRNAKPDLDLSNDGAAHVPDDNLDFGDDEDDEDDEEDEW